MTGFKRFDGAVRRCARKAQNVYFASLDETTKDANHMRRALCYGLYTAFRERGYGMSEIGRALGRSKNSVWNAIRMFSADSPEAQEVLSFCRAVAHGFDGDVAGGKRGAAHVVAAPCPGCEKTTTHLLDVHNRATAVCTVCKRKNDVEVEK